MARNAQAAGIGAGLGLFVYVLALVLMIAKDGSPKRIIHTGLEEWRNYNAIWQVVASLLLGAGMGLLSDRVCCSANLEGFDPLLSQQEIGQGDPESRGPDPNNPRSPSSVDSLQTVIISGHTSPAPLVTDGATGGDPLGDSVSLSSSTGISSVSQTPAMSPVEQKIISVDDQSNPFVAAVQALDSLVQEKDSASLYEENDNAIIQAALTESDCAFEGEVVRSEYSFVFASLFGLLAHQNLMAYIKQNSDSFEFNQDRFAYLLPDVAPTFGKW